MGGFDQSDRARRLRAILTGVAEPIVVVLLLIAIFTAISGKPLDGLLMLLAAAGLGWDAGHRAWERSAVAVPADHEVPGPAAAEPERAEAAPTRRLRLLAWAVGSAAFAIVVGTFTRYSWPATVAVIAVGVGTVLVGWRGPVRPRPDPGKLPLVGVAAWGGVLVAGSLWELWSLFNQPTLTTSSYDHPTISVLTDPALATVPGRSLALAAWVALGWYLVER